MHTTRQKRTLQDYVDQYKMTDFLNDDLLERLQLYHFPPYTQLYIEQEEQHRFYFLVEGQVQCNHYHLNGKLAVFALVEPFAALGDVEVLSNEPIYSNVIVTRDATMLGMNNDDIVRYGGNDPRFLRFLIDELRKKLYKSNTLQANQVLPVLNRLAVYMLAQKTVNDTGSIMLPEKDHLASLLGTTARHLNRVLKEMVDSGHISAGYPMMKILNREALESLS